MHQKSQCQKEGHDGDQKDRPGNCLRAGRPRKLIHAQLQRAPTGHRRVALTREIALSFVQLGRDARNALRAPALPDPIISKYRSSFALSGFPVLYCTNRDHSSPAYRYVPFAVAQKSRHSGTVISPLRTSLTPPDRARLLVEPSMSVVSL